MIRRNFQKHNFCEDLWPQRAPLKMPEMGGLKRNLVVLHLMGLPIA
jgi:hypothetical protein